MAHVFDVMVALNGYLNRLYQHYTTKANVRTINPPKFLITTISREIDNRISEDILVNKDAGYPIVDLASIVDTGDNFNPIYIAPASNMKKAIVDRVPLMINHKDECGPDVGYVIIVPNDIFTTDDINYTARVLRDLYFDIVNYDPNLSFKVDASMIQHSENPKMYISTYDITMAYAALAFAVINLKTWYVSWESNNKNEPVSASYLMNTFTDEEVSEDKKKNIVEVLDKYAIRIGSLRDAIGNGDLTLEILYDTSEE